MKKIFLVLLVSILAIAGYSQSVQPRGSANVTVEDARLKAKYNLVLPVFNDTTEANLWKGVDSTGALIFTRDSNSVWVRKFLPKKWVIFGNGTGGGGGGSGWLLGGNDLTNSALEYFGSSNYMDVNFGTNNLKRFSINKDGILPLAGTAKAIGIDSLTGYLTYANGSNSSLSSEFNPNLYGTYNFDFTANDSINLLTITTDGTLTYTKDTNGINILRATPASNFYNNRFLFKRLGQTWLNRWKQEALIVPKFAASATSYNIGVGITGIGDNQLSTAIGQSFLSFGFLIELGNSPSTSGVRIKTSSNYYDSTTNNYSQRFFTGLIWEQGDSLKLSVTQLENNYFSFYVLNLSNSSHVEGLLNYPLTGDYYNINRSTEAGYFSILTNGGDWEVKKVSIDYLTDGIDMLFVSNSIGYGYGLYTYTKGNEKFRWWNTIKDSIPYKSVLMASSGITTNDINKTINQISAFKGKYIVLDGVMTNDFFVSGGLTTSKLVYDTLVKTLKNLGKTVIHITPCPRGTNDATYGGFQSAVRTWLLATYPNDLVIDSYNNLLAPDSTNTLNPAYYNGGDGTHLNVAGHAVRASDIISQLKFTPYKGQTTALYSDSIKSNELTVNNKVLINTSNNHGGLKLSVDAGVNELAYFGSNSNTVKAMLFQNTNNGNSAGIGHRFYDSAGTLRAQLVLGGNNYTLGTNRFFIDALSGDMSLSSTSNDVNLITGAAFTGNTKLKVSSAGKVGIGANITADSLLDVIGGGFRTNRGVRHENLPSSPTSAADLMMVQDTITGIVSHRAIPTGGSTPTLQQVLTAGSTLTTDNHIDGGNNIFDLYGNSYSSITSSGVNALFSYGASSRKTSIIAEQNNTHLSTENSGATNGSHLYVYKDSIMLQPQFGNLYIDSLSHSLTATDKMLVWDSAAKKVATRLIPSGGGATPAGNYGNVQLNRFGSLATPASDSLNFNGGLAVKGTGQFTALPSAAGTKQVRIDASGNLSTQDTLTDFTISNASHYLPDSLVVPVSSNSIKIKNPKSGLYNTAATTDSSFTFNSDTSSSGLSGKYLRIVDTANIKPRIIAGTNVTITGTYPFVNISASVSGGGGGNVFKDVTTQNTFISNIDSAYATTATAAGTTTLTNASKYTQNFTGATTQTVVLPDATTLVAGHSYYITNNSSGALTVNKNGGTLISTVAAGQTLSVTVTDISTSAGGWMYEYSGNSLTASNFVFNETPSGTINGTNATFTLANTPTAGTVRIYLNGLRQKLTTQYTISGSTITMLNIPGSGDELIVDYLK